jgi:DNA-binding CsgD family transcriptional regulator
MGKSERLCADDVRSMLRLMGEIAERPAGGPDRMQHALDGIARLVRADFAVTTRGRSCRRDDRFQPYAILGCGFQDAHLGRAVSTAASDPFHDMVNMDLHDHANASEVRWPFVFVTERMGTERARIRGDGGAQFKEATEADIEVAMLCPAGTQAGHWATLGLLRENRARRKFSDRDILIASLMWEALSGLHKRPLTGIEPRLWGAGLSTRQAEVCDGLRAGLSVKQIARRLGLSVNTVGEYVGIIYKKYGVSSRGELLASFTLSQPS